MFCHLIAEARERVWIASPYFVPDVDTLSALKCAALRGCDVRILVPDAIDHYLPWLAAFAFFALTPYTTIRGFPSESIPVPTPTIPDFSRNVPDT